MTSTLTFSQSSPPSLIVNLITLLTTFIILIGQPGLSSFHKSFRGRLDVYDLTIMSDNRSEVYQTNSRFLMNSSSKPIVFPTSSPPLPAFDHHHHHSQRQQQYQPQHQHQQQQHHQQQPQLQPQPQPQPQARPKVLLPDLNENGIPKCVKQPDDTFCEQVDNYPRVDLRSDFGLNLDEFKDIFGEVKEIDARKSYFDDDSADERICGGPRKIVFPKMAKTQSKRWVYIVNDDDNFRQSVVTEICSRPGKPCAYLEDDNLPAGLSSQCRQKYARARLMALHPTEQRTYPEYFEFPSCCACYIKNPYSDRSKFRQ